MGVDRTDYLMWGAKIDSDLVDYEKHGAEMDGAPSKKFDLINDGMCGKYAVAGKVIARSDPYDGLEFKEISPEDIAWDSSIVSAVRSEFPDAHEFKLILFSHFD